MPAPSDDTLALRAQLQALFGAELTIERELGRGGMAAVFAATDHGLQRRVAVKMLLPEFADDPTVSDRFVREGRTVASLQHPHIVSAYGARSAHGTSAIVMQFVDGRSLDVVLAEQGVIPLPAAGLILSQVAAGLRHAHDRGVVHRDVKPANVLIDRDGRAVVSDFGIARRNDGADVTKSGVVLGTWDYMSPEQRAGERVTTATDQYAFGVLAFELLTGGLPFTGTLQETMRGHMLDAPPSLRARRAELSPEIEMLVHRLMAKSPEERLPSLMQAERAFATLAPNTSSITRQLAEYSRTVPRVETPAVTPATIAPAHIAAVREARDRVVLASLIAIVVLMIGVGGWALLGRARTPVVSTLTPRGAAPVSTPTSTPPSTPPSTPTSAGIDAARPRTTPSVTASRVATTPSRMPRPAGASTAPSESPTTTDSVRPPASPAPSPPTSAAAATTATPAVTNTGTAAVATTATLSDARQLGRVFVTMLNQRRTRELEQLPMIAGDGNARAELIRLTDNAPDFAAGYDRLPSVPAVWTNGFETDLYLDLAWRGGKRTTHVRLFAAPVSDGWRLAGIAVDPAS